MGYLNEELQKKNHNDNTIIVTVAGGNNINIFEDQLMIYLKIIERTMNYRNLIKHIIILVIIIN